MSAHAMYAHDSSQTAPVEPMADVGVKTRARVVVGAANLGVGVYTQPIALDVRHNDGHRHKCVDR